MPEQHVDVNQHPHTYQEIRDKQRIAHKLQMTHERRHVRNKAVQHQSGEERSQDALHTDKFHQSRT